MPYQKLKSERYANVKGINQKKSHYVTGDNEVLDLWNYGFSEVGAWVKRPGSTNGISGNTLVIGQSHRINNMWQTNEEFTITGSPATFVTTDYEALRYDVVTSVYDNKFSGYSGSLVKTIGFSNAPVNVNSAVYNHYSFFTTGFTGGQFFKNVGYRAGGYGLPYPQVTGVVAGGAGGLTGTYFFQLAYYDYLGFVGPVSQTLTISGLSGKSVIFEGLTLPSANTIYDPAGYIIYRDRVLNPATSTVMISALEVPLVYSGAGFNGFTLGYDGAIDPVFFYAREPSTDDQYTKVPDFLEVFNSILWLGFTENNIIEFSEVEEPENIPPENRFGFINAQFKMTGIKSYNQALYIFLQKGIGRATGDTAQTINFQQLTTEYGLVSNKATVVWNERLWFLDEDGIVQFDGSNFKVVSDPVTNYLKRMNLDAALQRACAYHYQERQEVWFAIPIDNATDNNVCLVYDYTVDAWTTFRGFIPTYLKELYTDNNGDGFFEKRVYYGSLGATLNYFGNGFGTDVGNGITLSFTTKYHNELGKSKTAQFRRFYLDTGPNGAASMAFGVNMYANYATAAISMTRTIQLGATFQQRIDFGIPAKSLSFKVARGSTTVGDTVQGYTVEFRYQRDV